METQYTNDSKGREVNVTTWCLLVVAIIAGIARLGSKYRVFHRLTIDDFFIVGSLASSIAWAIVISLSVASGYGKHRDYVSDHNFDLVMKNLWVGSLLCIMSLCLSKLSITLFISRLGSSKKSRLGRAVVSVVLIWAVATLLGTIFQCEIPRPWDFWNGSCIDSEAWYYFFCLSNLVTEVLILTQAGFLNYGIQATFKTRLITAYIFLPRVLVIGGIIGQICLIRHSILSDDPTYDTCNLLIAQGVVQCLSILTACWGQLKPFLTWLKSDGQLRVPGTEIGIPYSAQDLNSQFQSTCGNGKISPQNDYELPSRGYPLVVSVTRDWEVESQSSEAHIILENQHPWMGKGSEPTIKAG